MKNSHFSLAAALAFCLASSVYSQSTFTGTGDWLDAGLWDAGLPGDGVVATVNGICEISENIVATQTANPGRVNIGDGVAGTLRVTGGTLSGAHGSGGIYVGLNGGTGSLSVEPGAVFRSQGAGMRVTVGDTAGGTGTIEVSGELQIYKFLELTNGTLRMLPTGICNKFNSADPSVISAGGTLAYTIDGADVGTITRSNTTGLQLTIDPLATLELELTGSFAINDSWVLMDYTLLSGQFAQGTTFVNQQGYEFSIDYGSGANDQIVATLISDDDRPKITAFSAVPDAISAGQSSTLSWTATEFDGLILDPGGLDVTALTSSVVSPTVTTTYTLTAELGAVAVTEQVTVVVDELPVINSLAVSDALIAPGEMTTLSWNVSGADSVSIAPAPGAVAAVDSAAVSPLITTTYTLTASNGTGPVTQQVTVTVDALDAALAHQFDAGAAGQSSGAFLDGVGTTNIDMTNGLLATGISTPNTIFTAEMDRINQDAVTGGDAGDGFPEMPITFELWVSMALLDAQPQLIFETGSAADGSALFISESEIRLMHSTGGVTTIDISVPTVQLNTAADAIQITATLDLATGDAALYAKGASGGDASGSANGSLGPSINRASLFTWSGFGGAAGTLIGGTAAEVPANVTTLKGSVHLLNVYNRALTAAEVQEAFERKVITVPDGDTDGDGLPDFWELTFFPDIAGQDGSGNGDGDTLDHAAELAAGTDPTLADTDGDTLNDDVEINAVIATDPTNPDTDGDLLTDAEEINGAVPSNPTLVDTDADTFWDVFEIFAGSDPSDAGSLPPADAVGTPTDATHTIGNFASLSGLFPGADILDATFCVMVDFEEKLAGDREVIFETGGGTVGISLVYESGSQLVLRSSGAGGNVLATVSYTLSAAQIAAGDVVVIFSYDVLDDLGNSTIALYVDGAPVGSDSQALGGDWTGTNAASFGAASVDFAGTGANSPLMGDAFTSGTINLQKGLVFYQETLYQPSFGDAVITGIAFNGDLSEGTVTWDSSPGEFYLIFGSEDCINWTELNDGIPSGGASTTYTQTFLPTDKKAYFLRIQPE